MERKRLVFLLRVYLLRYKPVCQGRMKLFPGSTYKRVVIVPPERTRVAHSPKYQRQRPGKKF